MKGTHYTCTNGGKSPRPCDNVRAWAAWFDGSGDTRRVAHNDLGDGVEVSTVFVGLDYSLDDAPPKLWETMIFGGPHDQRQWRWSSYEAAVAGHAYVLTVARGEPTP